VCSDQGRRWAPRAPVRGRARRLRQGRPPCRASAGQGWSLARHRGGVPEGPAPARRLAGRRLLLVNERLRSTGDAADRADASDGALQLIARLNGKR